MVRRAWLAIVGMIAGIAAAQTQPAATQKSNAATASAPANDAALTVDGLSATFHWAQGGKVVEPDAQGIVHLRPEAFEMRLAGDVMNTGLIATTDKNLAKMLRETRKPIVLMGGTGSAFDDGDVFVTSSAALVPFAVFGKELGPEETAAYIAKFKKHMAEEPLLMNVAFQPIGAHAADAAPGAKSCIFQVTKLARDDDTLLQISESRETAIEWKNAPEMDFVLMVTADKEEHDFSRVAWRVVHVAFDGK